jgi:hypothetical protein
MMIEQEKTLVDVSPSSKDREDLGSVPAVELDAARELVRAARANGVADRAGGGVEGLDQDGDRSRSG